MKLVWFMNSVLWFVNGLMWALYAHSVTMALGSFVASIVVTVYAKNLDSWSY